MIHAQDVALEHIHVRRWEDGRLLGTMPVNKTFGQQVVIHRADLHNALIEKALALDNVKLRENCFVSSVDFSPASVTLADGTVVRGDIVIGADGIKSTIRGHLLEDPNIDAIATGDAAYRIMLPRSIMEKDSELKKLIDEPQATRWLGPARHIIAYPVRSHELYNVVLLHPDRQEVEESWTTKGSKQAMVDHYTGWDPIVRKLIDLVVEDEVLEWKLCLHRPLRTWIRGSVALIGDACHPMLYVESMLPLNNRAKLTISGPMSHKERPKPSKMQLRWASYCPISRRDMRSRAPCRCMRKPENNAQRLCSSLALRTESHCIWPMDPRSSSVTNSSWHQQTDPTRTNGMIARRRTFSGGGMPRRWHWMPGTVRNSVSCVAHEMLTPIRQSW